MSQPPSACYHKDGIERHRIQDHKNRIDAAYLYLKTMDVLWDDAQ